MTWYFSQSTGKVEQNGVHVGTGYSGRGAAKNNPDMENLRGEGPIPRGSYRIGPAYSHGTKGPCTMNLDPIGHNARGRTLFRIHGDSTTHPGSASEGCIVLPRKIREKIAVSGDASLTVTR